MIRRIFFLFRFTRSEQRSLVLLCSLLLVLQVFSQILTPDKIPDGLNIEIKEYSSSIEKPSSPSLSPSPIKAVANREKERRTIPKKKILEINTTDSLGFLDLYGIGPVFSGRIVKYRKLLGGYSQCDQLLEIYGMDSSRYIGFKANIRVDSSHLQKLDINTSSFKELLRHPYLDYEAVKKVVGYRDRHGPLDSPDALWSDSVLSVGLKMKLMPYLK